MRRQCYSLLLSCLWSVLAFAASDRPNILFYILDDWGTGHAGAYGCSWVKTPNFDRVAREGLLFTNAYTPTGKCTPSRSCIMTGRYPWQLGAAANHQCIFPPELSVFPEILTQQGGYTYASCGKVWAPGQALLANGQRRNLEGKTFNKIHTPPPATGMSDVDYAANFAAFLQQAPLGQPWFFWLGPAEPHRGYEYGSGVRVGGKKTSDIDRVPNFLPDNEIVRNDLLDYALEVEYADAHLGKILQQLEAAGILDQTLVIVTSDNGMPFPRVKGHAYEATNHLPLAMRWPAGIKNPGRIIREFVCFTDFATTFLQAAGVDTANTPLAPLSGQSLFDIFQQQPLTRDHVLIGRERNDIGRPHDEGYPVRGLVREHFLYLENAEPSRWPCGNPETGYLDTDGSPTKTFILEARRQKGSDPYWQLCFGLRPAVEFYDLQTDPDCVKNLATEAAHQKTISQMRTQLWEELRRGGDWRALGHGADYEAFPTADKKNLNFYERYRRGEKLQTGWVMPGDYEPEPLK
jgi:arylsulfatase A-like enzyme